MRARPRWWTLCVGIVVVLASCRGAARRPGAGEPDADLLLVGPGDRVTALDSRSGAVVFAGAGAPAFADPSEVFRAAPAGGETVLETIRPATGEAVAGVRLPGRLAVRVASGNGSRVALMAPLPEGADPWTPRPRRTTRLVVADPAGISAPLELDLPGNLEPEAFSTDARLLYMISFVPPEAPVAYRVVALDLARERVFGVPGREKAPVETMRGTRLMQVGSPDGARLYTLYSSQPPEYARGLDPAQARAGRPVAFVHTLDLREGWAACIGLPRALWGGNPEDQALAISPDGARVYVVDTRRALVAVVEAERVAVIRDAEVSFGAPGGGVTRAAVSPNGKTLLVASGRTLTWVDVGTLDVRRSWTLPEPVTAVGPGPEGRGVFLVTGGELVGLDPESGRRSGAVPARAEEVVSLAPLGS